MTIAFPVLMIIMIHMTVIKSRFQQIPDIHPDDNDNEKNGHNVDVNAINFADNNYVSDKLIHCVYF